MQVLDAVLDGAGGVLADDVARDAEDEDVAHATVEDSFNGEARSRAGVDGSEGVLAIGGDICATMALVLGAMVLPLSQRALPSLRASSAWRRRSLCLVAHGAIRVSLGFRLGL